MLKRSYINLFVFAYALSLSSCAFTIPLGSSREVETHSSDNLYVFAIDLAEAPQPIDRISFSKLHGKKNEHMNAGRMPMGASISINYITLNGDSKPYFLDNLREKMNPFSGKRVFYSFNAQSSPVKFVDEGHRKAIYLGTFKFKYYERDNFLDQSKFQLEKCSDCPTDNEIIQAFIENVEREKIHAHIRPFIPRFKKTLTE